MMARSSIPWLLRSRLPLVGRLLRRRALASLRAGVEAGDASLAGLLVEAADSFDSRIARQARSLIREAAHPAVVDALCEEVVQAPDGPAGRALRDGGKRPSDPEQACLYLFATGQLDAYFEEDYEFQNLRLAYDRAEPPVKEQVLRVLRSGDRRCLGFFAMRKKLSECTDREVRLALQSFLKHEDWPRLYRAFLELPVKYGFHILRRLERSGWEPEDLESRSLLHQAFRDVRSHVAPESMNRSSSCALFEDALEEGRLGKLRRLSTQDLLERLDAASPLDGVSVVGALALKAAPGSAAARRVAASPHWLVRLAGRVTGLSADVVHDEVVDSNYWVNLLAPVRAVLEFPPARATPAHLEMLSRAPPEAWEGSLGAARKVLRALVARRVTAGDFEEMVVEADAFAAEFEPADAADLGGDD